MALTNNTRPSDVVLNIDLYELTMAAAYFEAGMQERRAVFTSFFRNYPFDSAYCLLAGTGQIPQLIKDFHFEDDALRYLSSLDAPGGGKLFSAAFLHYLEQFRPNVDIYAIPEGELAFTREPLYRVEGALIACQLLETALLNLVNFQTLIATKAARVVHAAEGRAVSDFGLRRAQGPDGGLSVARASWIGGVSSTSNVLAGKIFDIPVFGTHAHSWVMSFPTQLEAFRAFAKASPQNCVLLLDTYSVESGVRDAIVVANELKAQGHSLSGVRIDSGDLAKLSKYVREELDKAGFSSVKIAVSNDLDEFTIQSLLTQGAPIDSFGVGTKLATADPNPSLGGVYKLSAVQKSNTTEKLVPVMKVSEMAAKRTIPGKQAIVRFSNPEGQYVGDVIYNPDTTSIDEVVDGVDVLDPHTHYSFSHLSKQELMTKIVDSGISCASQNSLEDARKRAQKSLSHLDLASKRFLNPQTYPVGLDTSLAHIQENLIEMSY